MLRETEVLVVGAGPAGIAAATAAARGGKRVLVLDDNHRAGGQIWRQGTASVERPASAENRRRDKALAALHGSGAQLLPMHRIFGASGPATLEALHEPASSPPHTVRFRFQQLILATGARELFLPFPGWTLPGVFGAGGLQALVAGGYSVQGKRVLVAGSGPLLLAVAAHLKSAGAHVVGLVEQAPLTRLASFALGLLRPPGRIVQGARYRAHLGKARFHTGCWPVEALPQTSAPHLRAVRLTNGRRAWEVSCDLLACGFHLVPNTELARLMGCAMKGDFVQVDSHQKTSLPNVFCVGEPTGIAGLDAALLQGEIAGRACAGDFSTGLAGKLRRERRFGQRLAKAFALRPELKTLPQPETLVCRCEDVRFADVAGKMGWTDAKLQSRCGMGACQARVCGPALHFLLGWENTSVRPPLSPVPITALLTPDTGSEEIA